MGHMIVDLTPADLERAYTVAGLRYGHALRDGRKHVDGADTTGANAMCGIGVTGCLGEIALARVLDVPWPAYVDTFHLPDIPPNWQARFNSYDQGWLCYRRRDNPCHRYALVLMCERANLLRLDVVGWCWGDEAADLGTWKTWGNGRRPHTWVPPEKLRTTWP